MPFDGITVHALTSELNHALTDGRVDKILQPEKDEINLIIRAGGKNHRLLISASAFAPRVHLTEIQKENPEVPPLFCMLLRKHISGGKVIGFYQPDFERIMVMQIECRDELGDLSVKSLYIEIMGRHSNVVLVDANGKILGCIKNVDISVSSVRQVLIGLTYHLPPSQSKINPLTAVEDEIMTAISKPLPADRAVIEAFTGISPLISREIAFCYFGDSTKDLSDLSDDTIRSFAKFIRTYFAKLADETPGAYMLTNTQKHKLFDYSSLPITQYGDIMQTESFETLSKTIDTFYITKDLQERAAQRSADLNKFINTNLSRCRKKLSLLKRELEDTKDKDKRKMCGDILTANIYKLDGAGSSITLNNFYTGEPITISLLPELSPSQNAQRYYTLYNKAKTAEIRIAEQLELCNGEIEYLEGVQNALDLCTTVKDFNEIRDELILAGYMVHRKQSKSKIRKNEASAPLRFTSSEGIDIYVGKNNIQNDRLTMKTAKNADLWFHVKDWAGSHTVLSCSGKEYTDVSILEAATIAAQHSKAKNCAKVPVDYTLIKHVKKPSGAKPGFVIYDNYKTIYVNP